MHGHQPGCALCAEMRRQQAVRDRQRLISAQQKRAARRFAPYSAAELAQLRDWHRPTDGQHFDCPVCAFEEFDRLLATAQLAYSG